MGLEYLNLWSADHQDAVARMKDEFVWWASRYLSDESSIIALSRFLSNDAGSVLLCDGLLWLDKANVKLDRSRGSERRINALADLLSISWQHSAAEIRANPPAFDAFRHILKRLVEIHSPTALALAELMKS